MKLKNIFSLSLAMLMSVSAFADETLYLIKGDKVVAKYPVSEVDYASFRLPEGVTDITPGEDPSEPGIQSVKYLGAVGSYFGTTNDVADFQIMFTSRAVGDENLPNDFLYLQFMAGPADYHDLKLTEGTYTMAEGDPYDPTRAAFRFYGGVIDDEQAGGSIIVSRPDFTTQSYTAVTGGSFTIAKVAGSTNKYSISGLLKLDNGNVLDFGYEGVVAIANVSDEQDPADEMELPASELTADVQMAKITEGYVTEWKGFLSDNPRFNYIYMLLYTGNDYSEFLQLGLLVDKDKYPSTKLPAGKYPIIKRTPAGFANAELASLPAFAITTDVDPRIEYGCWFITDYDKYSPLITGEVEVLEDSDLTKCNIKVTLRDNANPSHEVTATYSGRLDPL